jgi:hypothetical protein
VTAGDPGGHRAHADHTVIPLVVLGTVMADTKEGREKQARDADRRQREREIEQARERGDEAEPTAEDSEEAGPTGEPPTCHRRGCEEPAAFLVLERYQEETGHGAVEAEAYLCPEHTGEESPTNLDRAYADYVFRVTPVPGAFPEE